MFTSRSVTGFPAFWNMMRSSSMSISPEASLSASVNLPHARGRVSFRRGDHPSGDIMPQLLDRALLQSVWCHQFREKGSAFLPQTRSHYYR